MDNTLEQSVSNGHVQDDLAETIAALSRHEQKALWEKVRHINYLRDLNKLSSRYQVRLAAEGKLDQTDEEILSELRELREKIAAEDYDGL